MNSVFSRICLVQSASSMLFDDGEVHCRIYDLWLLWIYKQTIAWKWTGPLKHCNIDIVTSILMQNKLKCTSRWCTCLILQKLMGSWQKILGELLWFTKFAKVFSPPKFFTIRYLMVFMWTYIPVCGWIRETTSSYSSVKY